MKWKIESWVTDPSEIANLNDEMSALTIAQKATADESGEVWDARTMGLIEFSPHQESVLVQKIVHIVKTIGDLFGAGEEVLAGVLLTLNQKQMVIPISSIGNPIIGGRMDLVLSSPDLNAGFLITGCLVCTFSTAGTLANIRESIPFDRIARVSKVEKAEKKQQGAYVVTLAGNPGPASVLAVFENRQDAMDLIEEHVDELKQLKSTSNFEKYEYGYTYNDQVYYDLISNCKIKVTEHEVLKTNKEKEK